MALTKLQLLDWLLTVEADHPVLFAALLQETIITMDLSLKELAGIIDVPTPTLERWLDYTSEASPVIRKATYRLLVNILIRETQIGDPNRRPKPITKGAIMGIERRLLLDDTSYFQLARELVRRSNYSTVEEDQPESYPCIVVMFWQDVRLQSVVPGHAYIYPSEFSQVGGFVTKKPKCTRNDFFCSEECEEANYCQHMNDGVGIQVNHLDNIKALEKLIEEAKALYLVTAENKKQIEDLRFLCHEAAEWIHQTGIHNSLCPSDCSDCRMANRLKSAAQGIK